jgi:hypothetical protein
MLTIVLEGGKMTLPSAARLAEHKESKFLSIVVG